MIAQIRNTKPFRKCLQLLATATSVSWWLPLLDMSSNVITLRLPTITAYFLCATESVCRVNCYRAYPREHFPLYGGSSDKY